MARLPGLVHSNEISLSQIKEKFVCRSAIRTPKRSSKRARGWQSLLYVMGIISIPTLGLLAVGAIASIALGAIALSRIKKEPMIYGGKGMAIAGIITSIIRFIESKAAGAVRRDEGTPSNQQR